MISGKSKLHELTDAVTTMDRVRGFLSGTLDKIIDRRSLRLGFWLNLLLTLACVHSLIFGDLHMDVGSS